MSFAERFVVELHLDEAQVSSIPGCEIRHPFLRGAQVLEELEPSGVVIVEDAFEPRVLASHVRVSFAAVRVDEPAPPDDVSSPLELLSRDAFGETPQLLGSSGTEDALARDRGDSATVSRAFFNSAWGCLVQMAS